MTQLRGGKESRGPAGEQMRPRLGRQERQGPELGSHSGSGKEVSKLRAIKEN